MGISPLENATRPLALAGVTVAVIVTFWLNCAGLGERLMIVVVVGVCAPTKLVVSRERLKAASSRTGSGFSNNGNHLGWRTFCSSDVCLSSRQHSSVAALAEVILPATVPFARALAVLITDC